MNHHATGGSVSFHLGSMVTVLRRCDPAGEMSNAHGLQQILHNEGRYIPVLVHAEPQEQGLKSTVTPMKERGKARLPELVLGNKDR